MVEGILSDGLPMRAYLAAREGALWGVSTHDDSNPRGEDDFLWGLGRGLKWTRSEEGLGDASRQVAEYFSGSRRDLQVPLYFKGSPFQQRVWQQQRQIPFGEVLSYGEVAEMVGHPGAFRAVGTANGKNAIGLMVPCHRVIATGGRLGGYGSGLGLKRRLLLHEARVCGRHCAVRF